MVGLLSLISTGTATLRGEVAIAVAVVVVVVAVNCVDSIQYGDDDDVVEFVFTDVVLLLLLLTLAVKFIWCERWWLWWGCVCGCGWWSSSLFDDNGGDGMVFGVKLVVGELSLIDFSFACRLHL